jgi:hypothetical protein
MERLAIFLSALALGAAGATIYWIVQIPDQQIETYSTCVPIYYSGLECCK